MSNVRYDVPNESETVLSGVILDYDSMFVSSGGTALDTTVSDYSTVYVYDGGVAEKTTLNNGGYLSVNSGGTANSTTVNAGGYLDVNSGGTANSTTVNAGNMSVRNGTINDTVLNNGGFLDLYSSTTANNTTVNCNAYLGVSGNAVATGIVENGGYVNVADGATAVFAENTFSGLVVSTSRPVTVHSGTTALNTTMDAGSIVVTGGVATGTVLNKGTTLYVYSGKAEGTVINASAYVDARNGAVNNTTVKSGGVLILTSQAAANGIELASGGILYLSSAASATGLVAENGAALRLDIFSNTYLAGTSGGKEISVADGAANGLTIESGGSILIRSGVTATDTIVKQGGQLNVVNLGSAVNVVEDGGYVSVAPGAVVNFVEHEITDMLLQDSATATVHSGTTATRATVGGVTVFEVVSGLAGGRLFVCDGGKLNSATVSGCSFVSGGYTYTALAQLILSSGAVAEGVITACELGSVTIEKGAVMTEGLKLVEDGGGFDLAEGVEAVFETHTFSGRALTGRVTLHSGTTAESNSLSRGTIHVYEGGKLNGLTLGDYASAVIHSGAAQACKMTGGEVTIEKDAVASGLAGCIAYVGGTLVDATLDNNNTAIYVSNGGKLVSATILQGYVNVGTGCTLESAVVSGGACNIYAGIATDLKVAGAGRVSLNEGTTADGIQVDSGGSLYVGGSAKNLAINDGILSVGLGASVTDFTLGEKGALFLRVATGFESSAYVSGKADDGTDILLSGGTISDFTVKNNGGLDIFSGGVAENITASMGGVLVGSGGTLTNAVFSGIPTSYGYTSGGGYLGLSGGTASNIVFEAGAGLSMSGGTMTGVDVRETSVIARYGTVGTARISGGGMVLSSATATGTELTAIQVSTGSGEDAYVYPAGAQLIASTGGIAVDTVVGSACDLVVAHYASASKAVVNGGGRMAVYGYASGGGSADDVTVSSGGSISISDGATVTNLKLDQGALADIGFGSVTHVGGTYADKAFSVEAGQMLADFPVLENGFRLYVSSGGVLNLDKETTISDGASLHVYYGTVQGAEEISVDRGGTLNYWRGTLEGKVKENGGYVYWDGDAFPQPEYVSNTFSGVTLTSGMSATVHSGTTANSTLIQVDRTGYVSGYGAYMEVFSGGIVNDTDVDGGYLGISGGVASNTLVCSSAVMELDSYNGASAINTTVRDGGILWFNGGRYGSTVISKTTVSSGGTCRIGAASTETTAADTVVSSGGTLCIAPYYGTATMIDTVVEDGLLIVSGGGSSTGVIMSGTVFKGGVSQVFDYTYASGYNHTFSALDTTLESGAHVTLSSGSSVDGVYAKISYDGVQLKEKAVLEIDGGVYVDNVSATEAGATVRVLSGGSASNALIGNGAILEVAGDAEGCMVESGGTVRVLSGGEVEDAEIGSGGSMTLEAGAQAMGVFIDGGTMRVTGSGPHDDFLFDTGVFVTIVQNGTVTVESGAYLDIVSAGAGGRVEVGSDAVVTEMVLLTDGGEMHVEEGGQIFFIMNYMAAPSTRLLANDLSRITGAPKYNMVVSKNQTRGTYVFASGAADFDDTITVVDGDVQELGKLKLNETVKIGNDYFTLRQANGKLGVTITDVTGIEVSRGDVDNSGISDVLFQWTGGGYQLGYWMNGRSVEDGVSTWKCTGMTHSKDWEVLGNYVMDGDGNAETVLVGNVEPAPGFKGAYIGYYKDGVDLDENWVTIGYLTNDNNIEWKNKVGNLTGNADANSILWYAPELYALGVWKDGREDWQMISSHFGGDDWTLAGCGDFDGDGKDSVVMSYANGLGFYSVELDGSVTSMGGLNWAGWEIRAIGDFSGDRKDDVVLFHKDTGSMVLLADGNLDSYTSIGQLDPEDWFVVGAGDYNGDQKDDLLVRQYSTGTLGYYVCADQSKWTELGNGVSMDWTVIA